MLLGTMASSQQIIPPPYAAPGKLIQVAGSTAKLFGTYPTDTLPNSATGTLSFWLQNPAGHSGYKVYFTIGRLFVQTQSTGRFIIMYIRKNGSSQYALYHRWDLPVANTGIHHVIWSWDLQNNTALMYRDGVVSNDRSGITSQVTAYSSGYVRVPSTSNTATNLSDVYHSNEFIDLTVASNREKFRSSGGSPVYLGAKGELPTGNSPLFFFTGDASNWNAGINRGTVQTGFGTNGVITDVGDI